VAEFISDPEQNRTTAKNEDNKGNRVMCMKCGKNVFRRLFSRTYLQGCTNKYLGSPVKSRANVLALNV
jgi:hypothetical protein